VTQAVRSPARIVVFLDLTDLFLDLIDLSLDSL
jgi:hypothetical protein